MELIDLLREGIIRTWHKHNFTDTKPPYTQFHIFVEDTRAIESVLHKASFVICK